jgi:hypothetical protein
MPLTDDRGRLFGRINIIDAALVAFVVVLVPIGYTASRVFRVRDPQIVSVEPLVQPVGPGRRIRVHGRDFRPYLSPFVNPSGQPFSLVSRAPIGLIGTMRIETPTVVEIDLPELTAGQYDLYLFDETQQVAHLANAFRLAPPEVSVQALVQALVHARVRFVVPPELKRLVHERDVEATEMAAQSTGEKAAASLAAATLTRVRLITDSLPSNIDFGEGWGAGLIEAEIDMPARQNARGEWEHRGQILRVGERIAFQTPAYSMRGTIGEMRVTLLPGAAEEK